MTDLRQVPVKQNLAVPARSPFTMFGSLQREIDRLFDDFTPTFTASHGPAEVRCSMDLADTKDGLELTIEVPGLDEKDVQVAVVDGVLTVSGEKKFATDEKDKNYRFVERGYGAFARSVSLPAGAKTDQIKATLNKGVLKVAIPTVAKPEPKKIEIQATV